MELRVAAQARQQRGGSVKHGAAHAPALLFFLLTCASTAAADPPPARAETAAGDLCLPAISAAEQAEQLPTHLLRSIAIVESARTDPATARIVPWPWTINAAGMGTFYASKAEAIAAVQAFQARGIRSIDVGCAQVSLLYHRNAFASLDAAFDPQVNAAYAARFLNTLHRASGNWHLAAAGYHSQTAEIGYGYARRVLAIWPNANLYGALPQLPAAAVARNTARPSAPATPDYSIYTPEFAARSRRMDADRARAGLTWLARPSSGRGPAPIW